MLMSFYRDNPSEDTEGGPAIHWVYTSSLPITMPSALPLASFPLPSSQDERSSSSSWSAVGAGIFLPGDERSSHSGGGVKPNPPLGGRFRSRQGVQTQVTSEAGKGDVGELDSGASYHGPFAIEVLGGLAGGGSHVCELLWRLFG